MASDKWKIQTTVKELDEHLENAYKRISGLVGFNLGRDRMNLEALSESAKDVLDNLAAPGPLFMRIGGGLGAAAGCRPKTDLSLKEMAAEILNEFYSEATGAYQAARLRLRNEAEAWLKSRGVDEDSRRAALAAADDSLISPSREDMTRAAVGYVKELVSPGTAGIVGGFCGFGLVIATLRHPVIAVLGAVIGAAVLYYLVRKHLRSKTGLLLTRLPQDLYTLLKRAFIVNQERYEEIINKAAERK